MVVNSHPAKEARLVKTASPGDPLDIQEAPPVTSANLASSRIQQAVVNVENVPLGDFNPTVVLRHAFIATRDITLMIYTSLHALLVRQGDSAIPLRRVIAMNVPLALTRMRQALRHASLAMRKRTATSLVWQNALLVRSGSSPWDLEQIDASLAVLAASSSTTRQKIVSLVPCAHSTPSLPRAVARYVTLERITMTLGKVPAWIASPDASHP